MRYKTGQYAEALVQAIEGAAPEIVHVRIRAFAQLLKKHRMLGKAEAIARAAERRLAQRTGVRRVSLESPAPVPATLQKEIAGLFHGKVWIEGKVRPELLAGIRILIDDETLIDASGIGRLSHIFGKIASRNA